MQVQDGDPDELERPAQIQSKVKPGGVSKQKVASPELPNRSNMTENETADEEVDEGRVTDILFQYIPYYGQGDASNDSTVRAALSSLSVEDIDSDKDEYGNTLLILACNFRCEDLVRIMLTKGANPNAISHAGFSCLHYSCHVDSFSLNISKALLQNGANPEVCDTTYGCTPLHYCAEIGNVELCKLLLANGADISTLDYYNNTPVDYARRANMVDAALLLQQRLDAHQAHSQLGFMGFLGASGFSNRRRYPPDWIQHVDPSTGSNYFTNAVTNESLWEADLTKRLHDEGYFTKADAKSVISSDSVSIPEMAVVSKESINSSGRPSQDSGRWVSQQTTKNRLVAFLSKHDPSRLTEIESLLLHYSGKEGTLMEELTAQYGASEDASLASYQSLIKKDLASSISGQLLDGNNGSASANGFPVAMRPAPLQESRDAPPSVSGAGGLQTPQSPARFNATAPGIDSMAVQVLLAEERKKYDALEARLAEERDSYSKKLSEKEGLLSKAESLLETIKREKIHVESEAATLASKIDRLKLSGQDVVSKSENEIARLTEQCAALKKDLEAATDELTLKKDKVKSLEDTLTSLTAGNEERIALEKEAANEREAVMREREAKHKQQVQEIQSKAEALANSYKAELSKTKSKYKTREKALITQHEQLCNTKDNEIAALTKELAERKAQFAQEISTANLSLQNSRRETDDALRRMEAAEERQRSMEGEIIAARTVQQFNIQLHKDLTREQIIRKRLHNEIEDMKGKIRVYIRVRPMSNSESERQCTEATFKDGKLSVVVKNNDTKKVFDFDQVFGGTEGNSQEDVFRDTKHLMMSVVDGYNVCIFAYGQTGAGKSYTMIGAADIGNCLKENGDFDTSAGITPRAVSELFRLLNERSAQITYTVEIQMFQLYRDQLDDLLLEKKKKKDDPATGGSGGIAGGGPMRIVLAEHSSTGLVQVDGAEIMTAETPGDVMRIFARGSARRTTASTQMNAESSRSHLICSLVVKITNRRTENVTMGKLTLVDLAGSERVDKSGAQGEVLKEAQSINKSLSALGDVIAALTSGQQHVPYRNHPLTMLMSDSLGGNSKTLIFVNASPADYNSAETISSLSFGQRCKDVTNSVMAAPGVQAAQFNALKKELAKLKKSGGAAGIGNKTLTRAL